MPKRFRAPAAPAALPSRRHVRSGPAKTSKPRLESINNELTARNSELHKTVERQRIGAADMLNILNSANVAMILLDGEMIVRFFTPALAAHFNIVESDIGRPLAEIASRSGDQNLAADAAAVMADSAPLSREIETESGAWYSRRIFPCRAQDALTGGLVVTFADISEIKAAAHKIQAAQAYSNSIVETVRQPLVVVDGDLRIVSASKTFYETFHVTREKAVGRVLGLVCAFDRNDSELHNFFERIRSGEAEVADRAAELVLPPPLDRRSVLLSAREIGGRSEGRNILVTFEDISERKRVSSALETAKLQAERANLSKSRFLAAASHDLRQPLQTLALLRGILAKSIDDEKSLKLIARLDEPLGVMAGMLNTLLDINQLEAGIITPQIVTFPLVPLFDRLKTEFSYHAAESRLGWRVVASNLRVRSDPRLLEQMIRNLLSNSIKYTERGKILFGCRRRGDKLRLEVWDTGIGIPAGHLGAIFEEFHQIGNPARERALGLGLGLAIVQRIAQMLGHTIDVRSQPGRGSVFAVEVPLATEPVIAAAIETKPVVAISAAASTVLIVEDDPMVRDTLMLLFEADGYSAASVADGRTALELIASRAVEPDIVIADYNLPGGMTGPETIAGLRAARRNEIPAVILTGDISTDTLRKIADARCVHLSKPADADELIRLASNLVATRRLANGLAKAPTDPGAPTASASTVRATGGQSEQTVFVVDDDAELRATLRELLVLAGRDVETFSSSEEFLEAWTPDRKGCLVVDARMRGIGGLALLQRLKDAGAGLPAIMVTGYGDVATAVLAMKAGARDFIEKPVNADELIASVATALNLAPDAPAVSVRHAAAQKCMAGLTPRERSVMDLVLAGHPSKNIAADLGISQRTVENHRASIMKKTGSRSIPALIRIALAAA